MPRKPSVSSNSMEKTKDDGSVDFWWPEIGSLKVIPLGERKVSLRFMPSKKAVAEGLLMASEAPQGHDYHGECKRSGNDAKACSE